MTQSLQYQGISMEVSCSHKDPYIHLFKPMILSGTHQALADLPPVLLPSVLQHERAVTAMKRDAREGQASGTVIVVSEQTNASFSADMPAQILEMMV